MSRVSGSAQKLGAATALLTTCFTVAVAEPVDIRVYPEAKRQTLQGFGCSINAWIEGMQPLLTDPDFAAFAANELGMSVFRLQMWGGVLPLEVEDWREISYEDFVWDGGGSPRGGLNAQWAKLMVEANPNVKVIGAVWSPPAWMKENNSRTGTKAGFLLDEKRDYDHGNRLRDDRYKHFAKWVVEFARYMEAQGTPFYAISLQNELMFTQSFESTLYTPDEYARLVKTTAEMFESEGVRKPLFFGPEDMTVATYADEARHRPYVDALMQPGVAEHFDVFATHGYSDGVQGDSRFNVVEYWREIARFGRPYWITEGGSGEHEWPLPVTSGIAPRLHVALTEGNISLFCGWQLTSRPGNASRHNFMEWTTLTPKTYATMHFWRHLRPGTVRVALDALSDEEVLASAYVNEERAQAITIVINRSNDHREVAIDWGDDPAQDWQAFETSASLSHEEVPLEVKEGVARLKLPGLSITTVLANLPSLRAQNDAAAGERNAPAAVSAVQRTKNLNTP